MSDHLSARRLLLLLVCSLSVGFVAATPPPAPLPTPAPASPPAAIGQPVVMVYPFDVQTGADPKIGFAIAQILAQEMIAAGGITVPPVPQGVKRTDFLDNARTNKADFYISGYVTPVGDSAAVVEQVVSVESGVILFSQTAQVTSVADVASQSLLARTQILAFVGRGTQTIQTQTSNTPAPTSTNGAQVPIRGLSSIVDSVFKHKGARTPAPGPVVKPSRGIIIAPVTAVGAIAPVELTNATRELYFALDREFTMHVTTATSPVETSADVICGGNRDNTIATGTLQDPSAAHARGPVVFTLLVYTCFGAPLEREIGKGSTMKFAIDAAAAAYAAAHPLNN